jgi:precorrin-6A/cobalt-precorrin-6A reductase
MVSLWLIGGTGDSVLLAQAIADHWAMLGQTWRGIITVTTPAAQKLYGHLFGWRVRVGALSESQIQELLGQENITAIVDASHPFAVQISRTVRAIAALRKLPYLRYERSSLAPGTGLIEVDSLTTLLAGSYLEGHRVLLTVGAKSLPQFRPWQERAILFARILPSVTAFNLAQAGGFEPDRLIALRPPISVELELALWRQWQIELVVTKASGIEGGEERKRQVAQQLQIPLISLMRPNSCNSYGQQTDSLPAVLSWLTDPRIILP